MGSQGLRNQRRKVVEIQDVIFILQLELGIQYLRVRDALCKSGSSADEMDKFQWYNAVDQIISLKSSGKPTVLESTYWNAL